DVPEGMLLAAANDLLHDDAGRPDSRDARGGGAAERYGGAEHHSAADDQCDADGAEPTADAGSAAEHHRAEAAAAVHADAAANAGHTGEPTIARHKNWKHRQAQGPRPLGFLFQNPSGLNICRNVSSGTGA